MHVPWRAQSLTWCHIAHAGLQITEPRLLRALRRRGQRALLFSYVPCEREVFSCDGKMMTRSVCFTFILLRPGSWP